MQHRILITDDDRFLLKAYRALLSRDDSLAIDFASGPAQAHELMNAHYYDAALIDIELCADETGLDLLETLKRDHPATRVLMMSSRDDALTISRCLELGAADFASKNCNFLPSLSARVHGLVDKAC